MTNDEIIEMARQAGFEEISKHEWAGYTNSLEAFAKLVAAKEREACAIIVDEFGDEWMCDAHMLSKIIRARGEA